MFEKTGNLHVLIYIFPHRGTGECLPRSYNKRGGGAREGGQGQEEGMYMRGVRR